MKRRASRTAAFCLRLADAVAVDALDLASVIVPPVRGEIGGAALENAARAAWQSSRSGAHGLAPLPLTEAQAWAEARLLRPDLEIAP